MATANNGNYYSSGSNAYFNALNVNQNAPGFTAGISGFTFPGAGGVGFGANGMVQMASNGSADVLDLKQNSSGGPMIVFYTNSGFAGKITTDGTTTTYATSSDYRLKNEVVQLPQPLEKIMQLKPVQFKFDADEDEMHQGFIAHEVQTVCPRAVTGQKDEVDGDGNVVAQAVDLSKLVPLLIAAVQDLTIQVGELQSK